MKLNIGCKRTKKKDYINIDVNKKVHPDIVADVTKGLLFEDSSIQEIIAIHFLEHLFKIQVEPFLKECYRVLKPGGILEIEIPDVEKMTKAFGQKKIDFQTYIRRIFGGIAVDKTYIPGMHKWGWSEKTVKELLEKLKFEVTKTTGGKYHHPKLDTFIEARKK